MWDGKLQTFHAIYFLQVQEADIDGDQHVSFEEFRDIFNEG